jgi:hypothetical protein
MIDRPRNLDTDALPDALAVFPLPGAMLLPGGQLPLNIFEPRYLNMVEDALRTPERLIGMIQPVAERDERLIADGVTLYDIGCAGRITQFTETDDGRYVLTLTGVIRFRVAAELALLDGYLRVTPDFTPYLDDMSDSDAAETGAVPGRDKLVSAMTRYFDTKGIEADLSDISEAPDTLLVNILAMTCPLDPGEKQALLECPDIAGRAELLTSIFEIAAHGDGTVPHDLRQ